MSTARISPCESGEFMHSPAVFELREMSVCGDLLLRLVVDVGREVGMLTTS
jgi:hypothetical protein